MHAMQLIAMAHPSKTKSKQPHRGSHICLVMLLQEEQHTPLVI